MKNTILLIAIIAILSCVALTYQSKKEILQQKVQDCAVSVIPMLDILNVPHTLKQVIDYCFELHTEVPQEEDGITVPAPDIGSGNIII